MTTPTPPRADLFVIDGARPGDRAALEAIYHRASLHGPADRAGLAAHPELFVLDPAGIDEGRTRAARDPEGGALVGFATLSTVHDGLIELDDLFVDPPWMRRGVGRALVADACLRAWALGAERVEVTGNPQALTFYEAVGFVVIGSAETPLGPAPRLRLARPGRG